MRVSELYPSKYLSAADLKGREITATISHVGVEEMGDGQRKPILYFNGAKKGLVLNKTNANNISVIYGDDTDYWAGKPLTLFSVEVEFQGRTTPAIRVRPAQGPDFQAPIQNAPSAQQPTADELDDAIPF